MLRKIWAVWFRRKVYRLRLCSQSLKSSLMHYDFELFLCHIFHAMFLSERAKALVKRSHLDLESSMTVFFVLMLHGSRLSKYFDIDCWLIQWRCNVPWWLDSKSYLHLILIYYTKSCINEYINPEEILLIDWRMAFMISWLNRF